MFRAGAAGFITDPLILDELGLEWDARARRRPHAAGRLPLPPARKPAVRRRARAPRSRRRPSRRSCSRGRPSSALRSSRASCRRSSLPEHALDAQSLVALADLVVSAGGTMNREAVALGVPVYTTFAGELGAVDSALVNEGRLRVLTSADALGAREARESGRADRTRRVAAARPHALRARGLDRLSPCG